jgi:hypothetical protein
MQVQTSLNNPAAEALSTAVGKLIVNFGAVEFETYVWLACLKEDIENLPVGKFFKPRVDTLLNELATLDHSARDSAVGLWSDALAIAQFRNRIAHNPIFFGWNDPSEEGPPSFLRVLDMKGGLQGEGAQSTVSLAEINQHVDQTAALVQQLRALRKQIW